MDQEVIKNLKAILKDGLITYKKNDVNVSIKIEENSVILIRENDEMKITLKFEKDKKTNSFYEIKPLNLKIKITVKTKLLIISNNKLSIKYDLYMNGEFSDSFDYNLEWRDL